MTFYVVGEALSRQGDGRPLTGPSGDRLASLCGVSTRDLRQLFVLRNLCSGYEWSRLQADGEARRLVSGAQVDDTFLLLGRQVERVFVGRRFQFFRLWQIDATPAGFYTCPHPSGLSHWWNYPANVREAREFWRGMAELAAIEHLAEGGESWIRGSRRS